MWGTETDGATMILAGSVGWLFYFTVTFTNGHMIDLPFQTLTVCNEIRQQYLTRPTVAHVSACKELGK